MFNVSCLHSDVDFAATRRRFSARGRYFFRVSEHRRYLCFDGAKIRNFQALCKLFFKKDTKKSTLEKKVQFGTDGRWQFLF